MGSGGIEGYDIGPHASSLSESVLCVWWAGARRLGQADEEGMLITEGAPDAPLASAVSTDARFEFLRTVFNQEENDRCVR